MSKTVPIAPLSDVQRDVLATALLRADGVLALHDRVKGSAAAKVGQALLARALVREIRAKADLPVWRREAEIGRSFSLVLTKAGRTCAALKVEPAVPNAEPRTATPATDLPAPRGSEDTVGGPPASSSRLGSKIAEVVALLRRDQGGSVAELMAATGWLPHTTRAALTGLRKRGYAVTREAAATGSVYRIAEAVAGTAA